ncbi:DUF5825 family protein [Streptomyces sp. L2]|uniref:DUF5825 family protein n=1 Tax=Streptomyces sp. L2 TaxID=2162665 RepID=UPI00101021C9|nr:DUF5825 family protein [Streptomyces sp. L2]
MMELPTTAAHRLTGRGVEITDPLDLAGAGRETCEAVRFLRECQGRALKVNWRAAGHPSYDTALLHHLQPPLEFPDLPAQLASWQSAYSYGLLYYRRGPEFCTLMDRRTSGTATRLTLDHPVLLATFRRLQEPVSLDELDADERQATELLTAERLVLVSGGWAVALPPRARRWPVPCTEV